MARLRLLGRDVEVVAPPGATLLALVRRAGAPLGRSCGGRGVCRSCDLQVLAGDALLTAQTPDERRWDLPRGSRLACQARVRDDVGDEAVVAVWHPAWGPRTRSNPPRT